MSTLAQVTDRAMLLAMSQGGMPSPRFDNDYISELLYPLAMSKVVLEAGRDPHRQKDVRTQQNITVTSGVGTLPTNVALECLETAVVNLAPVVTTFTTLSNSADTITITAHGYWTGLPIVLTDVGTHLDFDNDTTYYIIRVDADTVKLASTLANAYAGTAINFTGTESFNAITCTPTYTRSTSYVPNYFDYTRAKFALFVHWTTKSGSFYIQPAGATSLTAFTGTAPFEAVVFPVVATNIDIVSGVTALAEDIIDSIVGELASLIRQEVSLTANA